MRRLLEHLIAENHHKEVASIYNLFYPRPSWADDTLWSAPDEEVMVAVEIWKLQLDGRLKISFENIAELDFEEDSRSDKSEYAEKMRWATWNRRGKQDLKDETWSGYRHLQALCPGEELSLHARSLPFVFWSPARCEGVTAGNTDPSRMLRWMIALGIRTIGIVGNYEADEKGRRLPVAGRGKIQLVRLCFSDDGIKAIEECFEQGHRRMRAILDESNHLIMAGLNRARMPE